MLFELSSDDQAFVAEVVTFINDQLPRDARERLVRGYTPARSDIVLMMQRLCSRGWVAPAWPVEYGGTGWSPFRRHLFEEVMIAHDAPTREFDVINLVGPVIYTFGTEAQKARFLPPMLRGDEFWCQGFSEPNAGSDLFSLRTRADRVGDEYIVNGQKIWTSRAHQADWIFVLARTAPGAENKEGISFLLIDLRSPGVNIRPIPMLNGETFLNEVFFEDVRVPAANLVGQEGAGRSQAQFLLTRERSRAAEVPYSKRDLAYLKRLAAVTRVDGHALLEDPLFARRLAEIEVDLLALEVSTLRVLTQPEATLATASVLKIRGSEMRQRLSELIAEVLGDYALAYYPDPDLEGGKHALHAGPPCAAGVMSVYLHRRAASIYGGSNEIQRNIIAKRILGL